MNPHFALFALNLFNRVSIWTGWRHDVLPHLPLTSTAIGRVGGCCSQDVKRSLTNLLTRSLANLATAWTVLIGPVLRRAIATRQETSKHFAPLLARVSRQRLRSAHATTVAPARTSQCSTHVQVCQKRGRRNRTAFKSLPICACIIKTELTHGNIHSVRLGRDLAQAKHTHAIWRRSDGVGMAQEEWKRYQRTGRTNEML